MATEVSTYKKVQQHVHRNIELLVDQLNRELQMAEVMRLNIALHVDHSTGRPIKVTVIDATNRPMKETP